MRATSRSGIVLTPLAPREAVGTGICPISAIERRNSGATCTTTSRSSPDGSSHRVAVSPAISGRMVAAADVEANTIGDFTIDRMRYSGLGSPNDDCTSTRGIFSLRS
jgi:hypothetical protein